MDLSDNDLMDLLMKRTSLKAEMDGPEVREVLSMMLA
jgi:succinate dehydrogenase flavin-adding protein (antitoxin of CptAB toxin-antitoxin module)